MLQIEEPINKSFQWILFRIGLVFSLNVVQLDRNSLEMIIYFLFFNKAVHVVGIMNGYTDIKMHRFSAWLPNCGFSRSVCYKGECFRLVSIVGPT